MIDENFISNYPQAGLMRENKLIRKGYRMNQRDNVALEIPGKPDLHIEPDYLPSVGTRIRLHKHLYDGGTTLLLEIVEHEWSLKDDNMDPAGDPKAPSFDICLRTRVVDQ